jgi:hypothetical protein
VCLSSSFILARPIDRKLTLWLGSLAALAAFNVGLWIWIARSASLRTPYAETQLLLSGVYVGVCGFRSLFPRVDLERRCLWDTWLSAILLGRTAATIAELCFALQCGLFVQRLSDVTRIPLLNAAAHAFVPLVVLAELVCWYAVLSLNHIGHAIEESLWALLMLILAAACGTAALAAEGPLRAMLIAGLLVYGAGAGLTIAFDVRMYVRRWRLSTDSVHLSLATGLRDSQRRRHPIVAWEIWREEVPWMTLYFSIGVWTSLAMVLLEGPVSRS